MNLPLPSVESSPKTALSVTGALLDWRTMDANLIDQWRELGRCAVQPNPFYEPWYLMPSLAQFDVDGKVRLFACFAESPHGQRRLVGLLPIIRTARYGRWPIAHISNWLHPNIFLGEPLIADGYEQSFWRTLLGHCDGKSGSALFLHINRHYAHGLVVSALASVVSETARPYAMVQMERRALLPIGQATPEDYAAAALTGKKRKELRRQANRLAELGAITRHRYDGAAAMQILDQWLGDFLILEAKGWKGRAGSALACDDRTIALFRKALFGAAEQGRLQLLDLCLNDRPIAMLANFITPPAAFSFKTAFDEDYARFSPGVLLQMDNLALLNRADLAYCDSCAAPDHPMIDSIWRERCTIARHSIGIGGVARRRLYAALLQAEMRRSPCPMDQDPDAPFIEEAVR